MRPNNEDHYEEVLKRIREEIAPLLEKAILNDGARFENPNLKTCWKIKKCGKDACPAFNNEENLRCWQIVGTYCGGKIQGEFADKYNSCRECDVYKAACPTVLEEIGEGLNNLLQLLSQRREIEKQLNETTHLNREFAAALEALRHSEERYHDLFENANDAIIILDVDNNFSDVNKKAAELLGYSREELLKMNIFDFISEPQKLRDMEKTHQVKSEGKRKPTLTYIKTRAGQSLAIEVSSSAIYKGDQCVGMRSIFRDITERKRMEAALRVSEERYRELVESLPAVVYSFSDKRGSLYYSARVEEILGYSVQYLYEHPSLWKMLMHPDDHGRVNQAMRDFATGKHFEIEYRLKDKQGRWHWFMDRSISLHQEADETIISGLMMDITERKRMEEEIQDLSMRDQLTGLYNRRGFITLAEQQLKTAKREKMLAQLVFIDTDGLKWVNDHHGHEEGDKVLNDTAEILRKTFRQSDVIARVGGDEFAVLAINTAEIDRETFFYRLQHNIDDLNGKKAKGYDLAMSWGCVSCEPDVPQSLDQLMSAADELMYAQKRGKAKTKS